MARTLTDPAPTSAVARLLDRDAALRALQPTPAGSAAFTGSTTSAVRASPDATAVAGRIKREFILTDESEATFAELLALFRRATQTRLTASQLFRAMLRAVEDALPMLQYEAERLGPLRLPGNGRDAQPLRDEFEARVAAAFGAGLRAAAATLHRPLSGREAAGRSGDR